jgi:hypothetical protein
MNRFSAVIAVVSAGLLVAKCEESDGSSGPTGDSSNPFILIDTGDLCSPLYFVLLAAMSIHILRQTMRQNKLIA